MFKLDTDALFSLPFIIKHQPITLKWLFSLNQFPLHTANHKQKNLTTSPPQGGGCAVLVFPVPRLLSEIWKSRSAIIRDRTCSQHGWWTAADRWCNMYRNYWQEHLEMFTAFWHCYNIQMQWYKHIDPWPIGNKNKTGPLSQIVGETQTIPQIAYLGKNYLDYFISQLHEIIIQRKNSVRVQNLPSQNMSFGHINYFKLVIFE